MTDPAALAGYVPDPPSKDSTLHPQAVVTETIRETVKEFWAAYCPTCGFRFELSDREWAIQNATACCGAK